MTNGKTIEWWQHYLVLPSEPQQKVTWTTMVGAYKYLLTAHSKYVRRAALKLDKDLRKK